MCLFILRALADSPEAPYFRYEKIGIRPQCDCQTVLGSRIFEGYSEKKRAELVKKGWSASKIKRAEESFKQSRLHKTFDLLGAEAELNHWLKAIPEMVQKDRWAGLVLHWGDDPVTFKDRKSVPLAKLTDELLVAMDLEVLYLFV